MVAGARSRLYRPRSTLWRHEGVALASGAVLSRRPRSVRPLSPALRQKQQFVRRILVLVRFCLQIEASFGRGCHLDVDHVIHPKLDVEAPPPTEDPRDCLVGLTTSSAVFR